MIAIHKYVSDVQFWDGEAAARAKEELKEKKVRAAEQKRQSKDHDKLKSPEQET